jgi:hypothetical protein
MSAGYGVLGSSGSRRAGRIQSLCAACAAAGTFGPGGGGTAAVLGHRQTCQHVLGAMAGHLVPRADITQGRRLGFGSG